LYIILNYYFIFVRITLNLKIMKYINLFMLLLWLLTTISCEGSKDIHLESNDVMTRANPEYIGGPDEVFSGDVVEFYMLDGMYGSEIYWTINSNYFERRGYRQSGYWMHGYHKLYVKYISEPYVDVIIQTELQDKLTGYKINPYGQKTVRIYKKKPSISGPDVVCDCETANYTISDILPGSTVTWDVSFGRIISGQGTPNIQIEVDESSSYNPRLSASISRNGNVNIINKDIHIGAPMYGYIEMREEPIYTYTSSVATPHADGAEYYEWSVEWGECLLSGFSFNKTSADVMPLSAGTISILVTAYNKCGEMDEYLDFVAESSY